MCVQVIVIFASIHPRYKQDVGQRLGLAAEAVAYGVHNVHYQGPFPTSVTAHKNSGTVSVEFDHGHTPIEVRSNDGYEVGTVSLTIFCNPSFLC